MTTVDSTTTHLRENPFELAREQLARVASTFDIDPNLVSVLGRCKKAIEVSIPVTMDDGSTVTVAGTLTDPSETSITPYLLMLQGGKCGSSPVFYVLSELDRQS